MGRFSAMQIMFEHWHMGWAEEEAWKLA